MTTYIGTGRVARAALASMLERRKAEVADAWLERVVAQRRARGRELSRPDLEEAMPDYLAALVAGLRGGETVEAAGQTAWAGVARQHAVTRVRQGFDVDELVRELTELRRAFYEVARLREGVLDVEPYQDVADLVEGAIAACVRSYVEARDHDARRREAEHIGFVTHELRNPLTTATLSVFQLRRELPLAPREARAFERLQRNLGRLAELIDGVLRAERFEAGNVEVFARDVAIGDLLDEPLASAAAAAEMKGLAIDVAVDRAARVRADPVLAASALANVLDNAVKYSDSGRASVSTEVTAREVVVHVHDNCPGVSAEQLRAIFEPFARGHAQKSGTGMGLSIAWRAMQAQGGSIQAEPTRRARGCHFCLAFPKAERDSV
jgi:signal transduction histidine kinase